MDDEVIPRRDAIAGLGLMAALLVALVGTIGVRIINSSGDRAGPPRRSAATIATSPVVPTGEIAIGSIVEAAGTTEPAASSELAKVQHATHEQAPAQTPVPESASAMPAPHPGSAAQRYSEAPRFIAPSGP